MAEYVLRGARRDNDGQIGSPLIEETINATTPKEAIRIANERDSSADHSDVNAFWLVDARGTLHWSLRRADKG